MDAPTLEAFCNGAAPGMPTWAIALIVFASIAVYCVIAGAFWAALPEDITHETHGHLHSLNEGPIIAAIFWPLFLPVAFGVFVVRFIGEWRESRRLPKATARKGAR